MPRFNALGEWCAGVAGTPATWGSTSGTGTAIPGGQGPAWVTNDVVVVQDCTGACIVKTVNIRTGVATVVASRGANLLLGGGGVWAGWLAGYGVFSSTGIYQPTAGLADVGRDGAVAMKRDYYSYGPFDVRELSGATWQLTAGDAGYVRLLGSQRAVWTEGGNPHTAGAVPVPNPMTRPYFFLTMIPPSSPTDPDGWWVLYQEDTGRLLLHPATSASGYVLAPAGSNTFGPDMVRMSPTSIKVVWSSNAGETPDAVVVVTVNTAASRTVLGAATPPGWTEPGSYARTGHSPAVAPHPPTGGWCSARVEGSEVIVEINAVESWRRTVGLLHNVSIGVEASGGTLVVAGALEVAGADQAYLITSSSTTAVGLASAAVRGIYLTPDAAKIAVCTSPYVCTIRTRIPTGVSDLVVTNPFPGGDSQGIIGLTGSVPIYAVDPSTGGYLQRHGLTIPRDAGPWTFGQIAGPDHAAGWNAGATTILQTGQTFEQSAANVGTGAQAVVGIERDLDRVLFVVLPSAPAPPTLPGGPGAPGSGGSSATAPLPEPPPPPRPRIYPHVDGITDWRAQQSVRLLWDRHGELTDQLDAAHRTIAELSSTTAKQSDLDAVRRAAGEALAIAQQSARQAGAGETPLTGPGSASEPIVAMSADPAQIVLDVTSSFDHFAPIAIANGASIGDVSYWIDKASHPDIFSDGKYYLGHNKYWEDRMDFFNPGFPSAANSAGGKLPALF